MSGLNNFKADVSSADYVIEKFYENPGKFASVVLRMYWDMKAERDTLIDDLKVLREKNEELQEFYRDLRVKCYRYHEAFEEIENRYTTLTDHIRLKASANPGVARYIALVNFVDRLERE